MRTLFSPWKQIVSAARRDQSLDDKVQAEVDNWVSRFVGLGVRLMVLFAAGVCIALVATAGVIIILLWPFVPLLPAVLVLISLGVLL